MPWNNANEFHTKFEIIKEITPRVKVSICIAFTYKGCDENEDVFNVHF
jgi:hypothetical protein